MNINKTIPINGMLHVANEYINFNNPKLGNIINQEKCLSHDCILFMILEVIFSLH